MLESEINKHDTETLQRSMIFQPHGSCGVTAAVKINITACLPATSTVVEIGYKTLRRTVLATTYRLTALACSCSLSH
jgi:hypothetical protein